MIALGGLMLPLLMSLIWIVAGAAVPGGMFLIEIGGWHAISGLHLLTQIAVGNLVNCLFVFCVTLYLSLVTKVVTAGLLPAVGYVFLGLLAMILSEQSKFYLLNINTESIIHFFPVVGLQNYAAGFGGLFIGIAAAHLIGSGALLAMSYFRFIKKAV